MKVAIIGSRSISKAPGLGVLVDGLHPTEIISGGAIGADKIAEAYAKARGLPITVIRPDWSIGRHAGFLRNTEIVEMADIVVAVWDGVSRGTKDSVDKAHKMGKQVIIFTVQ